VQTKKDSDTDKNGSEKWPQQKKKKRHFIAPLFLYSSIQACPTLYLPRFPPAWTSIL